MTTGTPAAPAGLALPSYERPAGVNPPLDHPAYRSAALRAMADPGRRATLVAAAPPGPPGGPGGFRFDIHLQGDQETVFFDV